MAKKTKFFKKNTVFSFQQSFFVQYAKILFISFQKQQMDYDYTKLLQLFIKPRHFHKKNELNIVTKPILSKILAACLIFFLYFQVFFLFCNLILKILRQTSFLIKKNLCFFLFFVKKIELLRLVSRETSDVLLSNIPHILFHVKQQQNPNTSRE